MMKNNIAYFQEVQSNDNMIRFIYNGLVIEFVTEKDRNMKNDNREYIVDGLNHLLEWAYENKKDRFLNQFAMFIIMLKNNLTSDSFKNRVNDAIKESSGKDEIDYIKGRLYADVFSNISVDVLYGILEYTKDNLVFNSQTNLKAQKIPSDVPSLEDLDIFIIGIIITICKLITLGAILLGKRGKLTAYTVDTIIMCMNVVTYNVMPGYLYDTGQMDAYNDIGRIDLHDNIYIYLRDIIGQFMEKNAPTTELLELNGKSRSNLIKEVIDYTLSTLYKIVPIDLSKENSEPFHTGKPIENYKFTARNIVNYTKKIIKINHEYKNNKAKHTNVVKAKKVAENVGVGNSILIHKQELRVEKKDSKELLRRKNHMKILSKYCREYIEEHKIVHNHNLMRNNLTEFFIIKLLNEISEDHITMKLMNSELYGNLILMISHRLKDKYFNLSNALLASRMIPRPLTADMKTEVESRFSKLRLFIIDKDRFEDNFYRIVENDYIFSDNNNSTYGINITESFFAFLKDDQDKTFEFLERYLYEYDEKFEG